MTLHNVIGFYGMDVEIKARGLSNRNKYNQKDTMAVLNKISIYADIAANVCEKEGAKATAKEARELSEMLYNLLDNKGYYD